MSIIVLSTCVPKINVGRTMNLAMNMIQLSKIPVLVMRNHTITFNWRNYPVTSPMNRHGFTGTPLIWMSFGLMIFSLLKSLSCLNGFYCFAFCVLVLQKNTQKMPKKNTSHSSVFILRCNEHMYIYKPPKGPDYTCLFYYDFSLPDVCRLWFSTYQKVYMFQGVLSPHHRGGCAQGNSKEVSHAMRILRALGTAGLGLAQCREWVGDN